MFDTCDAVPVLAVYRGSVLWILLVLRVLRYSSVYRVLAAEIQRLLGVPYVSGTTEGQILRVYSKSISRASNVEILHIFG